MSNLRVRTDDPFLKDYQPSELQIASEFLSMWLPFLSRDLCDHCAQTLSDHIRSLDPELDADAELARSDENLKALNSNNIVNKEDNDNYDTNSLGSWKDGLLKSRNKQCRCGRRAAVKILESERDKDKLYYACEENKCGFFEWWLPIREGEDAMESETKFSKCEKEVFAKIRSDVVLVKLLCVANLLLCGFICLILFIVIILIKI